MIKYLLSQLPNSVFNYLDQLIKEEKLRRYEYLMEDYGDSPIYTSIYKGHKIEIRSEQEKSYISTWSIYDDKGTELLAEEDDFYYSIGEAERAAIECLNQNFINDINSQEKN